MNQNTPEPINTDQNRIWEEPTLQELLVQQTAGFSNLGIDAATFPDCTRS